MEQISLGITSLGPLNEGCCGSVAISHRGAYIVQLFKIPTNFL